jgi:serine/threonine protein kinase/Tol biopolymer transport system component
MAADPPPVIDGYRVLATLGRGGMGEVWLARDLKLDRPVAIKLLPAQLTNDQDRVARFRLEARAASALNHPNVCTIHALGTTADSRLFIAMEYVEGATLRQRVDGGRLAVTEALDIAAQIAAGLGAAHAAGIIHRDIKPENIVIRSDGLVKVVDFGLAKLDQAMTAVRDGNTQTHVHSQAFVAGTIAYMSPEQVTGQTLDARTDIFSLGAVLYEMVSGQPPFGRGVAALIHDGILNRTPAPPGTLNPQVSPRLEDVILKSLEKDRTLRYQTVLELRTDLIRLERQAAPMPPRHRGRRMAITVGVLLLLGLVTFVAARWRALRELLFTPQWQEVQLTTNSSENPVIAAAISPDGRYVAYADQAGLHLRQIDGGETHTIGAADIGDINRVLWFPDGSKLIVSGMRINQPVRSAIWSIGLVGGALRQLRDDGIEASVSNDGSQIVFVDAQRHHLWVMGANGEEPHIVLASVSDELFYLPGFSTDSKVGFGCLRMLPSNNGDIRAQLSVELLGPNGRETLLSDAGLQTAVQLPDGRLLYASADAAINPNTTLWEGNLNPRSGQLQRRRLHDWPGISVAELTSTHDGHRIAFLKRSLQKDVYIADLTAAGEVDHPKRLTLDDSTDIATNWTPDSRTILFTSNRNGSFDIFRQPVTGRSADVVISGSDDEFGPSAVSPDGTWLFYVVSPRAANESGGMVMRTLMAGGAREKITDDSYQHRVLCARRPGGGCVLASQSDTEFSVYDMTGGRERGKKIASTTVERGRPVQADLSPDGTTVAIQMAKQGRIRVLSLTGATDRDVIAPSPLDGSLFFWSATGNGWYVSSTPAQYPAGTDLLYIDLTGHAKVIAHQNVRDWMSAVPSPDGRHLALTQSTTISNVWMLKRY